MYPYGYSHTREPLLCCDNSFGYLDCHFGFICTAHTYYWFSVTNMGRGMRSLDVNDEVMTFTVIIFSVSAWAGGRAFTLSKWVNDKQISWNTPAAKTSPTCFCRIYPVRPSLACAEVTVATFDCWPCLRSWLWALEQSVLHPLKAKWLQDNFNVFLTFLNVDESLQFWPHYLREN